MYINQNKIRIAKGKIPRTSIPNHYPQVRPKNPNFVYRTELPFNVQALIYDVKGWLIFYESTREQMKKNALHIMMDKMNKISADRKYRTELIIWHWSHSSGVECMDIMDKNIHGLILSFFEIVRFDASAMKIALSRYAHLTDRTMH